MTPSKHRTPTSFRDGLQGECIAMPFAQDQMVESCHFIKQFDSQAKCVLAGGDMRLRAGSAPASPPPAACVSSKQCAAAAALRRGEEGSSSSRSRRRGR